MYSLKFIGNSNFFHKFLKLHHYLNNCPNLIKIYLGSQGPQRYKLTNSHHFWLYDSWSHFWSKFWSFITWSKLDQSTPKSRLHIIRIFSIQSYPQNSWDICGTWDFESHRLFLWFLFCGVGPLNLVKSSIRWCHLEGIGILEIICE